jgi:hypothetical protein
MDSTPAMPRAGRSVGRRGQARPSAPGCDNTLARCRAVWSCRDLGLLLATRATRRTDDGEPRVLAVGVFPRDLARWLQALVPLFMPGMYRRVFRFTCIADLCDGYFDNRSSGHAQETS